MEYKEIKDLSAAELAKKHKTARADLFQLKMKNSLGQLANPIEIRDARRAVARVQTALTQVAKTQPKGAAQPKVKAQPKAKAPAKAKAKKTVGRKG